MGDLRNKIRKLQQAEGERRMRARWSVSRSPLSPPKCDGCGFDGRDQSRPDGTFVRLYSMPGDRWWKPNRIYCEFCLERLTGKKPYGA